MKLSNQTYEILKWVVQAVLPALITAIGTIGSALAWEHTEITMTILGAVMAFLGTSLGISSANYYGNNSDDLS